jgi:hypothetical protein
MAKITKHQMRRAHGAAKREQPKCHVMMTKKRQCSNDAGSVCKECRRATCYVHVDGNRVCVECRALPKSTTAKVVMVSFTTNGSPGPTVIRMQLQSSQEVGMNLMRLLLTVEQSLNEIQSDVSTHIDLIEEEV